MRRAISVFVPAALLLCPFIARAEEPKSKEAESAEALRKLEAYAHNIPLETSPSSAHMFIVNPLRGGFASLFSTHPSTESRIERLEAIARGVR